MSGDSVDLAAVKRLTCAVGLALLAGCGAPVDAPAPVPRAAEPGRAILYRDTVTVEFSDGALCVAPRPTGARTWQGQLAGCPHALPFSVTLPQGPLAPRRVLVRLPEGGTSVITLQSARFGLPDPISG